MRHTVLSGEKLDLDHPSDLSLPCTTFARWRVHGHNFEFGSGEPGFAEGFARGLGVEEFHSQYSYEGGTLKVGTDEVTDTELEIVAPRTWIVWRGEAFSFFTQRVDKTAEQLTGMISAFRIVEGESGVALVPRDGEARPVTTPGRPCVYKGIEGIGLMTIVARSKEADRRAPPWAGRRVRGGELFRGNDSALTTGGHQRSLYLVGPTASADLDIELDADDEAAVDAMSELALTWSAA